MNTQVISSEVKKIIASELDLQESEISDDKKLIADLGADSLSIVCIAMEIEKHFNIMLQDSEVERSETVAELISLTEKTL